MLVRLVWNKLWFKRLSSFLCILLLGIGVSIISLVANIGKQMESSFSSSISGIDMVVGAKGSPLQLILSSVFHIDAPTGNIYLQDVNQLQQNPQLKTLIPLSFGDNYHGYRIIGTNKTFLEHYDAKLANGSSFEKSYEIVLGSYVAQVSNLGIGDEIESSHGLDAEGESHEGEHYKVVGVLESNGTVLDKLIICDLESIWNIHHQEDSQVRQITAALVKFRSPMGLMTLPRMINENTNMQAALPSIEVNRLFQLFGTGIDIARYLAYLIIFISGLSVFISLYNSLKEQKNEKALMLSLGASRSKVFTQLVMEGLFLSFLGYLFGLLLSKIALLVLSQILDSTNITTIDIWQIGSIEIYLLIMALLIGIISAALPALSIYKIDISKTLSKD